MKRFIMGLVATLLMLQLPAQDTVAEYVDAVPEQSLTPKQYYKHDSHSFGICKLIRLGVVPLSLLIKPEPKHCKYNK